MEKITKLTKEQEDLLPVYRDKWIQIALSVEPTNQEEVRKWIPEWYKAGGLEPPKEIIFCKSPYETTMRASKDYAKANNLDKIENRFYSDRVGGNMWVGWQAYYDYMMMLGVEECKKLIPTFELSKQCGYILPYDTAVYVTEKPKQINILNGRFHNQNGPAVEWHDGWGLYSLWGITVPEWVVMTPKDEVDCEKVLQITNTEQRRVAIKHIGLEKFIDKLGAKVLDKKNEYELLTLNFENRVVGPYLKMACPSTGRIYIEGVGEPNDNGLNKTITTVEKALQWRIKKAGNFVLEKLGLKLERKGEIKA